ncbi:MAG: hypothetical protein E4H36_11915 [Spirochaetales bacterium]|nr:MAG: hypothetical protein E4H36_11915 [Spirochaetales bacterium]
MKRTKSLPVGLILLVFSLGTVFADDNMVLVEGGTFTMGDTAGGGYDSEKPKHSVTVSGFFMNKYEVTQKEFRDVIGFNPSKFKGDNLPVETVTWYDAVAYCNARSQKEGLLQVYTITGIGKNSDGNITSASVSADWNADGYRLPTEAEWEYAAKGGKLSRGYKYAGGNSEGSVAWYSGNSGSKTQPVGTKAGNELGIYDLTGNVQEWCWDWYGNYTASSQTDPRGTNTGSYRACRGNSWRSDAGTLRTSYRVRDTPAYGGDGLGFRPVRIDKSSLGSSFADSKLFRINTPDGLNMRDAPSTQGKVLALIPGGTAVTMLEEKGDTFTIQGATGKWTKVQWKDMQGWVFGGFLERISAPASANEG